MIEIEINAEGVRIENIKIHEEIFQEEKVDWRVEVLSDLKENLCDWIKETKSSSDKFQMKEDLQYLNTLKDEYVFSDISTAGYIAQSDDPTMFYDICRKILEAQGLTREEAEAILLPRTEITESQESYLNKYFEDRPHENDDYIQLMTTDVLHNNNWRIREKYSHVDLLNLRKYADVTVEEIEKEKETKSSKSYLLQERDSWYSTASAINLGIFSSLEKAVNAATKEYGEIKRDGTSLFHYEPVNNPNDVTIYIIQFETDLFEEQ